MPMFFWLFRYFPAQRQTLPYIRLCSVFKKRAMSEFARARRRHTYRFEDVCFVQLR